MMFDNRRSKLLPVFAIPLYCSAMSFRCFVVSGFGSAVVVVNLRYLHDACSP